MLSVPVFSVTSPWQTKRTRENRREPFAAWQITYSFPARAPLVSSSGAVTANPSPGETRRGGSSPVNLVSGRISKNSNVALLPCSVNVSVIECGTFGGGAGAGDQGERPDRECHGRHHREALHGDLLVSCSESAAQLRVRTKLPFGTTLTPKSRPRRAPCRPANRREVDELPRDQCARRP